MDDLKNKRVLVTGASTGIGAAVAIGFGAAGAMVGVHYNASRAEAEGVAATIRAAGRVVLPGQSAMPDCMRSLHDSGLAATVLGGDLGQAYLGTQGDIWDAHKDMALASLGALIAMLVTAAVNYQCQRDFARDWSESWKVRKPNADFTDGSQSG